MGSFWGHKESSSVTIWCSCGHREIFSKSYEIKPKSDFIYHFLISIWFNNILKIFLYVCGANFDTTLIQILKLSWKSIGLKSIRLNPTFFFNSILMLLKIKMNSFSSCEWIVKFCHTLLVINWARSSLCS